MKICSKCGLKTDKPIKFCPDCGSKITEKIESTPITNKMKLLTILLIVIIFIFIVTIYSFKSGGGTTGFVSGMFCKEVTEYRSELVTKYREEPYTTTENFRGCNDVTGCRCVHRTFFTSTCDACECTKTRKIPYEETQNFPYTVKKCVWD